jgi:hypothetical protein
MNQVLLFEMSPELAGALMSGAIVMRSFPTRVGARICVIAYAASKATRSDVTTSIKEAQKKQENVLILPFDDRGAIDLSSVGMEGGGTLEDHKRVEASAKVPLTGGDSLDVTVRFLPENVVAQIVARENVREKMESKMMANGKFTRRG